ncbi:hypothetical protein BKA66DRAFT_548583 [Pyrenochaeta sp. MPI-SDFR-AT-0127]|nr:hypothetical protein BKA66DRAFT_548583 [Pyrenochaeta sp. MPI-SDFR-AT-0127]
MPPRKDKLSKVEFRELIRNHGIRFEGPLPPKNWPDEYQNHFHAIRYIGHIQYEDYMVDHRVPKGQRRIFKERINYLRKRSYELLDDAKANEATWRELEQPILKRFKGCGICRNCHNELWQPRLKATFLHPESQAKLDVKHNLRRLCVCNNKPVNSKPQDSDDESRDLFDCASDETITHALGDDLHAVSIPMNPDRVYGLRTSSRLPYDYSNFPVKGRRILLPFLVVEAKRENDAPGFRAIQHQTAFPVRRLLKAQDNVLSRGQLREPSLVWFFAYQGEQWRLHAGALKNDKVRVYDLWQGTIQSQDDALQLLLIVDYIWSWARDVYRPSIRDVLFGDIMGFRELSPASTDRFRTSVSVSSISSSAPLTQNLVSRQIDRLVTMEETSKATLMRNSQEPCHSQEQEATILKAADSHPFLKWAAGHELSPPWTNLGIVRHSNVVQFRIECHVVSCRDISLLEGAQSEDGAIKLFALSFSLLVEDFHELAALWAVGFNPIPLLAGSQTVKVTFSFQTFCDPSTWQITRVLSCIVWMLDPPDLASQAVLRPLPGLVVDSGRMGYFGARDIRKSLLYIRQIHGDESVWCAMHNVSLILMPGEENQAIRWASFDEAKLPETASETLMNFGTHMNVVGISSKYLDIRSFLTQVDGNLQVQLNSPDNLGHNMHIGDSLLAVRSQTWPATCPKFCLFILSDGFHDSQESLRQLLEDAVEAKNICCHGNRSLSYSDWEMLHHWRKALKVN